MRTSMTAVGMAIMLGTQPLMAAKTTSRTLVEVDGKSYKVIRYNNGTVKVTEGGMIGKAPGLSLRDAMRRAVAQATGCSITDDFFVDAKLMGTLSCSSSKNEG